MADQEYNLIYKGDNSDILAKSNVVIRLLRLLDQMADRLIPKLPKLFQGAGRAAGTAAPKIQQVATSLTHVQTTAGQATTAILNASSAMNGMNSATRQAAGASRGLSSGLGGVVGVTAGLGLVREAMSVVADAMKDARDFARETAEEVLKVKDAVRELAAIKGQGTKEASAGVVDLMLASGAKQNEAIAFETMWESALPAAQQNVDPATGKSNWQLNGKETLQAKREALRFAIANGIDPATMGRMIPSIGIGQPVKNKDDLMGQLAAMHAMAVQGVGTFSPIMKIYNALRPTMINPNGGAATKSSAELLGVISAQTVTAGKEARVTQDINQVWRDLSFPDNETKQKTFEKYGLKNGDDYVTRVENIAPLLLEGRAKGIGDLDTLKAAGFGRQGSNPKIIAAVNNRAVLRQRFNAVAALADPTRVEAMNKKFHDENPNRFAEANLAAARLNRGEESKDLEVARKFAEAEGTNKLGFGKGFMNAAEGFIDMRLPYLGSVSQGLGQEPAHEKSQDMLISQHILKNVPNAAKRFPNLSGTLNVHPTFQPARGPELAKILRSLTPEERQKVMNDMEQSAGKIPARRAPLQGGAAVGPLPGAGGAPAPGVVGPQAMHEQIQRDQLTELKRLNARVAVAQNPRPAPRGPLRSDVDESGNIRT